MGSFYGESRPPRRGLANALQGLADGGIVVAAVGSSLPPLLVSRRCSADAGRARCAMAAAASALNCCAAPQQIGMEFQTTPVNSDATWNTYAIQLCGSPAIGMHTAQRVPCMRARDECHAIRDESACRAHVRARVRACVCAHARAPVATRSGRPRARFCFTNLSAAVFQFEPMLRTSAVA